MSGTSGRAVLPQPPTKTIVVYRNGDAFYPGRKFVVNQRQVSTFGSFLSSVTRGVEAPFGAVRNVYTPREGHKVFDLDSLQHGERYVAAGAERFKKLDYYLISSKKPQKKKSEQIRPVVHSRIVVPARWRKISNESCTINVFTNGDVLVPPARILIPKYTLTNWESVLSMVTEKINLRTGAVHRLCALDGTPLEGSVQLENNQFYVAVGVERFRWLPYCQWVPSKGVVRDISLGQGVSNDNLPAIRKGRYTRDGFAHPGFGEDTARGPQARQQTDSYFYAKPGRAKQQKQVSRIPLLLTTGEGSVFRARHKRRETVGATEVQEEHQVKVDLPIDQVEAKVVEEERDEPRTSRPGSGKRSPYRAFLRGSDTSSINRPLSATSRMESSGAAESGRGTGLTSSRHGRLKSPPIAETLGSTEGDAPSKLCGIRSRMSNFFKERSKK